MTQDIVIQGEEYRFGLRTVGVAVKNGKLLVQREKNGNHYALIGGAVQVLETTEQALIREFKEETGADIKIKRLLWTEEDFWNYKGRRHHGLAFYYLVELENFDITPDSGTFTPQKDDPNVVFGWLPLSELDNITIYPTFIKDEIYSLKDELKHFVTKE
ncbi:MAG: NUDIX domain-containing protein [Clostridia bacterium]|nr:NUDIX domain-containing protein [Clostridia bacterium]